MARIQSWMVVIGLFVLGVLCWAGVRAWQYSQLEGLRNGVSAMKAGEYDLAMAKIFPYAQSGNRLAQELVGQMYAFGLGVTEDNVQAALWFRLSECVPTNCGNSEYGTALGYLNGLAGRKDASRATEWLKKAAEAGNVKAQSLLANPGEMTSRGFASDEASSTYWQQVLKRNR